ncbi:MAG TPA: alanine racemase [Deltaproteobacteria bacterium]|nr:alanine racemase [Deltaproteobacteria bacterium]
MHERGEDRPVRAWIDLDAVRHNARRAIDRAAGRSVIGVVKANGYGHGADQIARGLLAEGVSRLAVVSVAEGAALRRAGIVAPVLLLGGLDDDEAAERALKWGLTPVIHDERGFELARSFGRGDAPWAVEVEVDTGMHRMGVVPGIAPALLARIRETPQLLLSGLFTHLARADESDPTPSRDQIDLLAGIHRRVAGVATGASPIVHVANSAGLLRIDEIETAESGLVTRAVRPGLMLYGVSPFSDRSAESLDLEPVMSLAARVVSVRPVAKGAGVGYGGEWRAPRDTRVATLPLGYADGIPRALSDRGEVFLGGAMRPIVGRVSMDYFSVEIGHDGAVGVGDLATIFGRTPEGRRIPVENLARAAGTIGYELLVGVGARVPRQVGVGLPPSMDSAPLDPAV